MKSASFIGLMGMIFLVGCGTSHVSEGLNSGIYSLSARSERDACVMPRSLAPIGEVGVIEQSGALYVAVPDALRSSGTSSVLLDALLHSEDRLSIPGCSAASLTRTFTVTGFHAAGFEVSYLERCENVGACNRAAMPANVVLPEADCEADVSLNYHLEEACAAPCSVVATTTGVACSCE